MRHLFVCVLLALLGGAHVHGQNQQADLNKPFPPHKVIGYPEIAQDYVRSFKVMRSLPVDVFLGAHGSFYNLTEKHARLEKGGGPNPFIDPEGFKQYVDRSEKTFQARLEEQQKAAGK